MDGANSVPFFYEVCARRTLKVSLGSEFVCILQLKNKQISEIGPCTRSLIASFVTPFLKCSTPKLEVQGVGVVSLAIHRGETAAHSAQFR